MTQIYVSDTDSEAEEAKLPQDIASQTPSATDCSSPTGSSSTSNAEDATTTYTISADNEHQCYTEPKFEEEKAKLQVQAKEIWYHLLRKQFHIGQFAEVIIQECQTSDPNFTKMVKKRKADSVQPPRIDLDNLGEPVLSEVSEKLEYFKEQFIKHAEDFKKPKKADESSKQIRDILPKDFNKWLSSELEIETLRSNKLFTKRLDTFKTDFLRPFSEIEKKERAVDRQEIRRELEKIITDFLNCLCVYLAFQAKVNAEARQFGKRLDFEWFGFTICPSGEGSDQPTDEDIARFSMESPELRAKIDGFMKPFSWDRRANEENPVVVPTLTVSPTVHELYWATRSFGRARRERVAQSEKEIKKHIRDIVSGFDRVIMNLLRKIKQQVLIPEHLRATVVKDYLRLNNRVRTLMGEIDAFTILHSISEENAVALGFNDLTNREAFMLYHAVKFEDLSAKLRGRICGWCCDLTALEDCKKIGHLSEQEGCHHRSPKLQWYLECGECGLLGDVEKGLEYFRTIKNEASSGLWRKKPKSIMVEKVPKNLPLKDSKKSEEPEACNKGSCRWEASVARNWGVPLLLVGIWGVHVALALRRR